MWRPRFNLRVVHVEFLLDRVALGQVIYKPLGFPLPIIIPPMLYITVMIGSFETSLPRDQDTPLL
jgi:hypothetical protein